MAILANIYAKNNRIYTQTNSIFSNIPSTVDNTEKSPKSDCSIKLLNTHICGSSKVNIANLKSLTVSMLFKLNSFGEHYTAIFECAPWYPVLYANFKHYNIKTLGFTISGDTNDNTNTDCIIELHKWYHLVFILDSTAKKISIFINGRNAATRSYTDIKTSESNDTIDIINIPRNYNYTEQSIPMWVNDIFVADEALSISDFVDYGLPDYTHYIEKVLNNFGRYY